MAETSEMLSNKSYKFQYNMLKTSLLIHHYRIGRE